jgi:hypothetical protein
MTVAHLFFDNNIIDAQTNYEVYKKNPKMDRTYDINDTGFQELI